MKSDFVVVSDGVMLVPIFVTIAEVVKTWEEKTLIHTDIFFPYEKKAEKYFGNVNIRN
jgi:hypothetical protein